VKCPATESGILFWEDLAGRGGIGTRGGLKFSASKPMNKARVGPNVKILLVEDSRTLRVSNERALLKAGYEVICAEDGEAALQCAKAQMPDLILLDLLLPRLSGLEVLTRLKHNRATACIPVVALTGLSEKNRQKLIDAGAEDYLTKNTILPDKGPNRLAEALEALINRINRKRGSPFSPVLAKR
jgi:two-component system cell cycle response regulator DivK